MSEEHRFDSPEFLSRLKAGENKAWNALIPALIDWNDKAWRALVYLLNEGHKKDGKGLEEGEKRAYDELLRVLWRPLNSRLRGFTKNMTDSWGIAEDIALQTVHKVISKINQFKGDSSSFITWVYKIAGNTAITYKRKKLPPLINFDDLPGNSKGDNGLHISDGQPNQEDEYFQKELKEADKRWVATLHKADKLLWKLRDGVTEQEVADLLNVSEEVVRARFSKLGKNLQKDKLTEQDIADFLNVKVGTASNRLSHLRQERQKYLQPYCNTLDQYEWQGMQVVSDGSDGVVVIGVRPRSAAMKVGIEISDRLIMFGNKIVHNVNMFAIAASQVDTPSEVAITIKRGHKKMKIILYCRGKNGRGRA